MKDEELYAYGSLPQSLQFPVLISSYFSWPKSITIYNIISVIQHSLICLQIVSKNLNQNKNNTVIELKYCVSELCLLGKNISHLPKNMDLRLEFSWLLVGNTQFPWFLVSHFIFFLAFLFCFA